MEDKIREYEKFIEKKTSGNLGPIERVKLAEYHKEMVANFQHERLVHLLVMLFFVAVTLGLICALSYYVANFGWMIEMWPLYTLVGLVVILSAAYVKHYYFLENHIQKMYKYNRILRIGKNAK